MLVYQKKDTIRVYSRGEWNLHHPRFPVAPSVCRSIRPRRNSCHHGVLPRFEGPKKREACYGEWGRGNIQLVAPRVWVSRGDGWEEKALTLESSAWFAAMKLQGSLTASISTVAALDTRHGPAKQAQQQQHCCGCPLREVKYSFRCFHHHSFASKLAISNTTSSVGTSLTMVLSLGKNAVGENLEVFKPCRDRLWTF